MGKRSGRGRGGSIPKVPAADQKARRVVVMVVVSLAVILLIVGISLFREGKVTVAGKAAEAREVTDGSQPATPLSITDIDSISATTNILSGGQRVGSVSSIIHRMCQSNYCFSLISPDLNTDGYCYPSDSIVRMISTYTESNFADINDIEIDLYCENRVWVYCDSFTNSQRTADGRFICKDTSLSVYQWVPAEMCGTESDEDDDGAENCADSDCFSEASCRGQPCATGKIVTWSYLLPDEEVELSAGSAPARKGCCEQDECITLYGNCAAIESLQASLFGLCEPDQNWHRCTATIDGQTNPSGRYVCENTQWRLVCSPANKYKTEYEGVNKKICDGRQWRDCDSVTAGAIQDLNVEVSCTRGATVTYHITEIICNNGLDDDNDGDTDGQDDPDCTADNLGYRIGRTNWNDRYEVIIKSTDDFTVSINQP